MKIPDWIKEELFDSLVNKEKIIKYVELAFNSESELYKECIDNAILRRRKAADLAGFKRNIKGLFDKYVEDFINGQDEQVNRITVNFLQYIKNDSWTEIVLNENYLLQTSYLVMNPLSDDEKDKDILAANKTKAGLLQEYSIVASRLKKLKKEFYGEDSDIIIGITPQNAKKG